MDLKFLNKGERFILNWTGAILIGVGGAGLIFTIFFDQIAGRLQIIFGWVQVMGVVFSLALILFGICVDRYLNEIKVILKDYVRK